MISSATPFINTKNDMFNNEPIIPFPKNFKFGTATAAYQIEGAWNEDGKGPNIWDWFSHIPGKIANNDNGDVADDHYHQVKSDIEIMKKLGLKNYRMSISWSRIIPTGLIKDGINQKGIDHYNNEINQLVDNGINVYITLYHWDLPLGIHQRYNGWLNASAIVPAFTEYADLCFGLFGDRVKEWITFNEPWVTAWLGYGTGGNSPGRCTGCNINGGNSSTEPYIVAHNQLLAHAQTVKLFREKYQKKQNGKIGITLNSNFNEPISNDQKDIEAAERQQQFDLGWFADPVVFGDYPQVMKDLVGDRLPKFTPEEKNLLKGSLDFFGLNHYTSNYVKHNDGPQPAPEKRTWETDSRAIKLTEKDGKVIGILADSDWLYVVPWGIRKILNWIDHRYNGIPIYITENGVDAPKESSLPVQTALNDTFRVDYLRSYINEVSKAILIDNCNVQAYFCWSLMDNFEWADGYSKRFGIVYVDYKSNGLPRYFKNSALWYSHQIREFN
ncbi:hypothetical protein ABK040_013843 [Willaertia magna]